jgi:RNA 2',3'-cyclic 3'-phosphodiesterase
VARDHDEPPPAKPLRLFIAADVPEDVQASLDASLAFFRDRIPGARWTQRSGWHVTLKFLGRTWPRLVDEIKAAVERAAGETPPFETALTAIGAFPSERRAQVLWAGLSDAEDHFETMVKRLDDLLDDYFMSEDRAFTPHLTVARLTTPRALDEFVPDLPGMVVASRAFPIGELVLYRSHLSPKGATYEPLGRWPLGGGAG